MEHFVDGWLDKSTSLARGRTFLTEVLRGILYSARIDTDTPQLVAALSN